MTNESADGADETQIGLLHNPRLYDDLRHLRTKSNAIHENRAANDTSDFFCRSFPCRRESRDFEFRS